MREELAQSVLICTYRGHAVQAVAWSPHGQWIASLGHNNIHVWDAATGSSIFTYFPQQNRAEQKLTGFWNWFVPEQKSAKPMPTKGPLNITAWRWAPTNLYLTIADSAGRVLVWDIITKKNIATMAFSPQVTSVTWSPDEKRMLINLVNYTVREDRYSVMINVWEILTGKATQIYSALTPTDNIPITVWSPDGQRVAVASKTHGVYIWNTAAQTIPYYHTSIVSTVAWSLNSRFLATGSVDHAIRIWETSTEDCIFIYRGHSSTVKIIAWSPNSAYMASISTTSPIIHVWSLPTGKEICKYAEHTKPIQNVTWLSNGQQILSEAQEEIRIWDISSGKTIFASSGTPFANNKSAQMSPDRTHVAFIDDNRALQTWSARTGNRVLTYLEHGSFVWSPDSTRIVSIALDGIARVWQAV